MNGWTCPECDESFEGKLPPLSVKHKCPECTEVIIPEMIYECDRCDTPAQAELHDVYLAVKRSGSQTYTIYPEFGALEEAHKLPPIDIRLAIRPFNTTDYFKQIGVAQDRMPSAVDKSEQIRRPRHRMKLPPAKKERREIPFE